MIVAVVVVVVVVVVIVIVVTVLVLVHLKPVPKGLRRVRGRLARPVAGGDGAGYHSMV